MTKTRPSRPTPHAQNRGRTLNYSSAPKTEREWVVFRAGVLEGVELAQEHAAQSASNFKTRTQCSGVALSTPSAPRRRSPS